MLSDIVAVPFAPRKRAAFAAGLADSEEFLDGIHDLPGVTRVFPASTGISRWFDEPITAFVTDGPSVIAWVTVGLDRHANYACIVGMVGAYLRARLSERGFDLIEVRVRVALLD